MPARKIDPYALANSSAEYRRLNPHLVGRSEAPAPRVATIEGPEAQSPAKGVKTPRRAKGMNKTENSFAYLLSARLAIGEIVYYRFEGAKLLVGECSYYCADFLVIRKGNQRPLFIEVKGPFIREDSIAKWKAAKEIHSAWCDLEMHQLTKEGWKRIR